MRLPSLFSLMLLHLSSSLAWAQYPSTPFKPFPDPAKHEVWYGTLEQPQQHLRVLFTWTKGTTPSEGKVLILDQAMLSQPIGSIVEQEGAIRIEIPAANVVFTGKKAEPNEIVGEWKQGEATVKLILKKQLQPMVDQPALVFQSELKLEKDEAAATLKFQFRFYDLMAKDQTIRSTQGYFDSLSEKIGSMVCEYQETDGNVTIDCPLVKAKFTGTLSADGQRVVGKLEQNERSFEMTLQRVARPVWLDETPLPTSTSPEVLPEGLREVRFDFQNAVDHLKLSGTLTLPAASGKYPAVVLLSGPSQPDRGAGLDSEQPYRELAHQFALAGYASLRFDMRGTGLSSGQFKEATLAKLASDAVCALEQLSNYSEIDGKKLALLGHGDGAAVAIQAAAWGPRLATILLLSPPRSANASTFSAESILENSAMQLSPWQASMKLYNPSSLMMMTSCQVLTLYGEKDGEGDAQGEMENMVDGLKRGDNPNGAFLIIPGTDAWLRADPSQRSDRPRSTFIDERVHGMLADWLNSCFEAADAIRE